MWRWRARGAIPPGGGVVEVERLGGVGAAERAFDGLVDPVRHVERAGEAGFFELNGVKFDAHEIAC